MTILSKIWGWPNGFAWKGLLATGYRLRSQRFDWFMKRFSPTDKTTVLDVGVTSASAGTSNFFAINYPFPQMLTAVGIEDKPAICNQRNIKFVQADGCDLPFEDNQFDIVHSNAVIEHVGNANRQAKFIYELCRVAKKVYISTPNANSPLETHTLIPFAHWLPRETCWTIYRALGREYYADINRLNLISPNQLRSLFPEKLQERLDIKIQYLAGIPAIITGWLDDANF